MDGWAARLAGCAAVMLLALSGSGGCSTAKGTGALAGGGIGALIGAAAGDTQGAVIGAAIGTGVGYIIGDQVDEKRAKEMSASGSTQVETAPLTGTKWRLTSVNTSRAVPPYVSKVVEFRPDGHVLTTTTKPDGNIEVSNESYRVVGDTLIVNKPGYMVNAKYHMDARQLILNDPGFSAVLERLPS
jgi:hypothetical protein